MATVYQVPITASFFKDKPVPHGQSTRIPTDAGPHEKRLDIFTPWVPNFKPVALILGESPLVQYSINTYRRTWIRLDTYAAGSTNEDQVWLKCVRCA